MELNKEDHIRLQERQIYHLIDHVLIKLMVVLNNREKLSNLKIYHKKQI